MERREFLTAAGGALMLGRIGSPVPIGPSPAAGRLLVPQTPAPPLGPEVFARRLDRLRAEMSNQKLDCFIVEPSTNFAYFTGGNPGRSERLIALLVPLTGNPVVICPSFEVERVKRGSVISDVRGWEEDQDPWKLVGAALKAAKPPRHKGELIIEPSFDYGAYLRLADVAGNDWHLQSAADIVDELRMIKYPEEIAQIRQAIQITQESMSATFAALTVGATEQEVAVHLSQEMAKRGSHGGGLVQFGPSSALPHGGPGGSKLEKETVVLIDCGCSVAGYTSDITRTQWFGDAPSDEFKKVFNLVHDAQSAAMQLGKPFTVTCEQMDAAARGAIVAGGYGQYFTHRLGHGMGMDGHEAPYLVHGNTTRLEPGMVFTIEPGIYQPGKFGVRIEDDNRITEDGLEVLSTRAVKL